MEEKIKECEQIIVDKIYSILKSGKEISAETFIGLSNVILKLKKYNSETKTDSDVI